MADTITIRDGNCALQQAEVVKNANGLSVEWLHTSKDVGVAVSQGLVPDVYSYRKFGYNPTITATSDPEDITLYGGITTLDAWGTAPIESISSTSAADAGIQVLLEGLDINGDVVSQVVTLGAGRTALTTNYWRFHRGQVLGSTALTGNLFIYTGTGTVPTLGDATIRGYITSVDNQTQQCIYTVPDGKVFMLIDAKLGMIFSAAVSGPEFAVCKFQTMAYNGLWTTQQYIAVTSSGASSWTHTLCNYPLVAGRSAMKLLVQEVSTSLGMWGEFCGYVLDESLISNDRLAAIGQPGY